MHVAIIREKKLIFSQLTFHLPNIEKEWRYNLTGSVPKTPPSAHLINPRSSLVRSDVYHSEDRAMATIPAPKAKGLSSLWSVT